MKTLILILVSTPVIALGNITSLQQARWMGCSQDGKTCYSLQAADGGQSFFSQNLYINHAQLDIYSRNPAKKIKSLKTRRGVWLYEKKCWLLSDYSVVGEKPGAEFYFYPDAMKIKKVK